VRVFLSYSHENTAEANNLRGRLEQESDIEVTLDAIDLPPFGSPKTFMDSVREHDAVVHLISLPFLRSKNCMRELLAFMKDDTERNHYLQRTVPIIIEDPSHELNLFETDSQMELVDYWMGERTELEEQINSRGRDFSPALEDLRRDLTLLRDIAESIMRFMRTVTENIYVTPYGIQEERNFIDVVDRLRAIEVEAVDRPVPRRLEASRRFMLRRRQPSAQAPRLTGTMTPTAWPELEPSDEVKALVDLHDSIVIPSESDPDLPEFPPFSPRFPATPSKTISLPQIGREIIVKDESHNFTGSHKDRMAWEIVVYYKSIIQDLLAPHHPKPLSLPSASIISNGSAALAIQVMLRCYGLPPLKVLVDALTDPRIVRKLEGTGCEVYPYDLSDRELDSVEVLRLTDNEDGFDVTARNLVDPTRRTYYDWLAYEILNCGAKHIFIPVGTGDLYVNVLTVVRDELIGVSKDKRLSGGIRTIEGLEIYGATSNDRKTKMDKLYATHRPTLDEARRVASEMRDKKLCGAMTGIYDVKESIHESVVDEALAIARASKIRCDESGIAGLALLLQMCDSLDISDDEDVLVVNTGWLSL
jgi:hypothetical protein